MSAEAGINFNSMKVYFRTYHVSLTAGTRAGIRKPASDPVRPGIKVIVT